jgi:hypothetical protein
MTPALPAIPAALAAASALLGSAAALVAWKGSDAALAAAAMSMLAGLALFTARQGGASAMSWLRSRMSRAGSDFSTTPPARRVTIRIRCHR